MPDINSDIQYLKGVGPAYAKKFAKLGIYTIRDLLLHYPRRYIDYSQPYTVVSAPFDVDCCVKATVLQRDPDRRIKGGRMLSHVLAGDDTGMLALSWFNAPYAAEKLEPGTEYYFEGRVGGMMTRREILHPLVRTEAQVAAAPLLPRTVNVPSTIDLEVLTAQIHQVTLYGPKSEMEELSADSILAQVDCQNLAVSVGQQTVAASIQVPSSSHIFAVGNYTVQCQASSQ